MQTRNAAFAEFNIFSRLMRLQSVFALQCVDWFHIKTFSGEYP